MEQRRPRLGDIVDDYCPRERRVTNHAVVAMIEDEVKQTRCTTCDADHDYKHARIPPQRKKKEATALDGPFTEDVHVRAATPDEEIGDAIAELPLDASDDFEGDGAGAAAVDDTAAIALDAASVEEEAPRTEDDGPVHRRLIRATLPRQEGQVPERKEPDFTIRQPSRGGRFDGDGNGGNRPRHQRGGGGGRGQFAGSGGGNGPQRFGGGQRPQRQGGGGQQQNGNGNGNRAGGGRPAGGGQDRGGGGGRRRGR